MPSVDIGARLKAARLAAGLTQRSAAEQLGVTERTYSRWEKGEHLPTRRMLERVEQVLGVVIEQEEVSGAAAKPTVQQLRDEVAQLRQLVDDLLARLPPGR